MGTVMGARWAPLASNTNYDHGLQPGAARAGVLWLTNCFSIDGGFDHYRARSQQHGIYGSEVVILSVKNEEDGEADQVAPAEHAVGLEAR